MKEHVHQIFTEKSDIIVITAHGVHEQIQTLLLRLQLMKHDGRPASVTCLTDI